MLRKSLLLTFICLSSSVWFGAAQDANSTSPTGSLQSQGVSNVTLTTATATIPSFNSSSSQSPPGAAGNHTAANESTTAASPSSSAAPSTTSATTSQSSSVSSSSITTLSSSSVAAASSSSGSPPSQMPSSPSTISTTEARHISMATTTTYVIQQRVLHDTTYIPIIAAIISGFGMLVVLLSLFLAMALAYRHIGRKDPMMAPLKKTKKGEPSPFYTGMEPQSAQYLVSSMSNQSFASSPSDARLESHLPSTPGVHYNRGFDVDHNPSGHAAVPYESEDGFRPIQIIADVSGSSKSSKA